MELPHKMVAREGDITFMLSSSSSCVVEWDPKRVVDERFDSVGGSKVKINYGEWVDLEDEDAWD
jgi:hypothetical protein